MQARPESAVSLIPPAREVRRRLEEVQREEKYLVKLYRLAVRAENERDETDARREVLA